MLVDDDKNSREGYQMYLSAKGFRVHAFGGGVDALAFAKSSSPDLVVLDLGLPDVDGWEVARRLKKRRGDQGHPHHRVQRQIHAPRTDERLARGLRRASDETLRARPSAWRDQEAARTETPVSAADASSDPY